ncbi:MAG: hypothetical protein Q8K86_10715 [Candidatus Nanopelagicaceae bacterium]|nr:hypothetical protein [Candidatus Nanopelagicaceae bacterium]
MKTLLVLPFLLLFACLIIAAGEEAAKADPVLAKVHYDSAQQMLKNGNRVEDAIRFLGQAITADPNYKEALALRGHLLVQLSKYDEARPDYRKVLDLFEQIKRALNKDETALLEECRKGWELTDAVGRAFETAQKTLRDAAESVQRADRKGAALLLAAADKVQETAEQRGKEVAAAKEEKKVDPIVGKWVVYNMVYTILSNNTILCDRGGNGTWRKLPTGVYQITWSNGYHDEFDIKSYRVVGFDKIQTQKAIWSDSAKKISTSD